MVHRIQEEHIKDAKATLLMGPRQVGESTLLIDSFLLWPHFSPRRYGRIDDRSIILHITQLQTRYLCNTSGSAPWLIRFNMEYGKCYEIKQTRFHNFLSFSPGGLVVDCFFRSSFVHRDRNIYRCFEEPYSLLFRTFFAESCRIFHKKMYFCNW